MKIIKVVFETSLLYNKAQKINCFSITKSSSLLIITRKTQIHCADETKCFMSKHVVNIIENSSLKAADLTNAWN